MQAISQPPSLDVIGHDQRYLPRSSICGLREYQHCVFKVHAECAVDVFIDDIEVLPDNHGRYTWRPEFVAGRVDVVVVAGFEEYVFYACVEASASKLVEGDFDKMAGEVHQFRAALLLDYSGANRRFGLDPCELGLPTIVKMARLIMYAPAFLQQLRRICEEPHRKLLPAKQTVALSRVKRLPVASMREPRISSLIANQGGPNWDLDDVFVVVPTCSPTFDTPANRALKALLVKISAQVSGVLTLVRTSALGGDQDGQSLRRGRREQKLMTILAEIADLLNRAPFTSVRRVETSAASLTQIAAQPAYNSAYRTAVRALWTGMGGSKDEDHLPMCPTWGVYEAWCFVRLLSGMKTLLGDIQRQRLHSSRLTAQESWRITIDSNVWIEIHFQARFPSEPGPKADDAPWSLSRLRIPDIAVVLRSGDETHFVILDAKFRQRRDNVLEAMESAHLYHDSLRIGTRKPDWCVLLLPAEPDVAHLDQEVFIGQHGVGTICEFSPSGVGVQRCISRLQKWMASHTTSEHPALAAESASANG